MAGIKISALPAAASAQLTDVFPADQDPGPVTRKITLQQVQDLFSASGVISLEGTQNEVLVNGTYGTPITGTAIKLSTPQQIATTSSPTFAAMTVNGAISNLTFINDVNGNHVLGFTSPSSAVNYIGFQNAITGVSPSISVLGSDTNVGLTIASKGTGTLNFDTLATTNQINFITGTTYQHATVFNFANTAFSRTVTWPDATGTVAFTSDLTGFVTSVSGTTNRITSTGGTTPVIDISASYVGQSSITTLGTIATGVWQGTLVGPTYGGTGVNNGSNTLTLAGNLATVGAFSSTFTMTGATNVTFPTSGTLATTASASGIVNAGLVNQMAWYASSGSAVSGLATVANSVLSTSAGSVPSMSTTLPSSLNIPNPNIGGSGLFDVNGNAMLAFGATGTAVNYYQLVNAAAGGSPYFLASGADSNINIQLFSKGVAGVLAAAGVGGSVPLSLLINSSAARADFNIASLSTTRTFTFPDASGTVALTSGASGIVNSGTANQLAYYATTGTAVSGLTSGNSGVLITSGAGVPSISSTLPSGIAATNMNLTTPTLGVASATSISFGGSALSVYATGTWTPIDVSGASLSLTATGGYTRIGNMVFAYCSIVYPVTVSGNTANIGGLPFTSANANYAIQGVLSATTSATAVNANVQIANTAFIFTNATGAAVANSAMSATTNNVLLIYPIA